MSMLTDNDYCALLSVNHISHSYNSQRVSSDPPEGLALDNAWFSLEIHVFPYSDNIFPDNILNLLVFKKDISRSE